MHTLIKSRRKIAKQYDEAFKDLELKLPEIYSYKEPVYYRYIILVKKLEHIKDEMKKRGVSCEKPVSDPLPTGNSSSYKLPNTDYVFSHALSIPIYPNLTDSQIEYIIKSFKETLLKI